MLSQERICCESFDIDVTMQRAGHKIPVTLALGFPRSQFGKALIGTHSQSRYQQ